MKLTPENAKNFSVFDQYGKQVFGCIEYDDITEMAVIAFKHDGTPAFDETSKGKAVFLPGGPVFKTVHLPGSYWKRTK